MNPSYVSPSSASTSGDIGKSLACQKIPEGAVEGTYLCVHRGSTLGQCDVAFSHNSSWADDSPGNARCYKQPIDLYMLYRGI